MNLEEPREQNGLPPKAIDAQQISRKCCLTYLAAAEHIGCEGRAVTGLVVGVERGADSACATPI